MKTIKKTFVMCSLFIMLTASFGNTVAFATEIDTPTKNNQSEMSKLVALSGESAEQTSRKIETYSTGTIATDKYAVVFSSNPWIAETWTIGRVSGTEGKIDIEVRDEFGTLLGSKAFLEDGDGKLVVKVPWDSGKCTVRVYNQAGVEGSWNISIGGI